jgi:HEAT repeat protein
MAATNFSSHREVKNDPARNQTLRIRQLAVHALGAMRDKRALGRLAELMNTEGEPRMQVAAAKAILEITGPPAATSRTAEPPAVTEAAK